MRVIGGLWRGRRLVSPEGTDVRPTVDRVREAIFGTLAPVIEGAAVLDVFGGSGALGIEAASRGAAKVVIIEKDRRALKTIRENLSLLGNPDSVRLLPVSYERAMKELSGREKFSLFFVDPPYRSGQYVPVLERIIEEKLADGEAAAMLESDHELDIRVDGFMVVKKKRYGSVHITYGDFE